MKPYHSAGAPSVERGVLARMKRLDPSLVVTWSEWEVNPITGQPFLRHGRPIFNPAYYLWRRDDVSTHHHFLWAVKEFNNRNVLMLERDAARFMRARDIAREIQARRDARQFAEREAYADRHTQISKANKSRIGDLVFDGKLGRRQANVASYPGQTRHDTPGEILPDPKDDGWEGIEPA